MDNYREYILPRDMMIDEVSFVNFGTYKQVDSIYKLNKELKGKGIIINKGDMLRLPMVLQEKDNDGEKEQVEQMIELWD